MGRLSKGSRAALVLAMALALALALAACGGDTGGDEATETATETTEAATQAGDAEQADRAASTDKTETAKPAPKPTAISAAKLYQAYDENSDAAKAKYDGKRLRVSGEVWNVSIEEASKPYLTFKTGSMLASVRCSFAEGQEARLSPAMKGGQLTLSCVCEGQVGGVQNVHLKDCRF
jgi:hypothetical protein